MHTEEMWWISQEKNDFVNNDKTDMANDMWQAAMNNAEPFKRKINWTTNWYKYYSA